MTFWQQIKRDLLFYQRSGIGTLLLAAVCSAILTGALLVGDSVQYSLRRLAHMRLGKAQYVCSTGEQFFNAALPARLESGSDADIAGVLAAEGILESPDGRVRIGNIHVYGVDKQFGRFSTAPQPLLKNGIASGAGWVNQALKVRLGQASGDLLLRLERQSSLSKDLIFAADTTDTAAHPVSIAGIVPDEALGRFSLQTLQEPPLNLFVPIDWLAEKAGVPGKANMMLLRLDLTTPVGLINFQKSLRQNIELEDYGLEFRTLTSQDVFEVRTPQIFIEDRLGANMLQAGQDGFGILTYFVNEIRSGEKSTPYSMVAGLDPRAGLRLADDEIAVNEWLAADLDVAEGDTIELTYFQVSPTRTLVEQTHALTVVQVVPMMGPFADDSLMPDFPGLTAAQDCRNWQPGMPVDLEKIRDKDEAYWDTYRGAPKAFVSLATAQRLWGNPFGQFTAVRWPMKGNDEASIRRAIGRLIDPLETGFAFKDVRDAARRSAAGSTDFSGLFAGLSMFLIFSAAILLGLVFVFYIESRAGQIGILQAVGFSWLKIFALFMAEGGCVAFAGCCVGALASVLYTAGLIAVLNATFWARALADLQLVFHAEFSTLLIGICVSLLICVFAVQIALYHRIRRPIVELLSGAAEGFSAGLKRPIRWGGWLGVVCTGIGLLLPLQEKLKQAEVAVFFLSGVLMLIGTCLLARSALWWLRFESASFVQSPLLLAVKNIPRRIGRSMVVLMTLACGVFMVISVGTNHKNIGDDVRQRHSGTGGFALLAKTTVAMVHTPYLEATGDVAPLPAEHVVSFRRYLQDDASCLNLNRAAEPTLLGVVPESLAERDAFAFRRKLQAFDDSDVSPWLLLNQSLEDNVIAAIGDYATVKWGLRKQLGDLVAYHDENGQVVFLKIVGILQESVLQGRLIISEDHFVRHFPSVDGKSLFLIDAEPLDLPFQTQEMTRKYRDFGMEIIPAVEQLARYNEVENTYMAIFLILGGLGLAFGSAGLGLVLVLNVLDRQRELAMMQAVGFRKTGLTKMLFVEHGLLLTIGLLCGLVPALLAVIPVMGLQGRDFPTETIVLIVLAMLASGALWIRVAIDCSVRTDYLETLRNE